MGDWRRLHLKRPLSGLLLVFLFVSILTFRFNVHQVRASSTIYIRADGSIDPPTANITTSDNITYIFTGNNYDDIVVERNNTTVDGKGYTLEGAGSGSGFRLAYVTNVIIKDTNIKGFSNGVYLLNSSNNTLIGNNLTTNRLMGIYLKYSSNNTIYRNWVNSTDTYDGIYLQDSSNHNSVFGNNLTNNRAGIHICKSSNNSISGNHIADNRGSGVWLRDASNDNVIAGNDIKGGNYGWKHW